MPHVETASNGTNPSTQTSTVLVERLLQSKGYSGSLEGEAMLRIQIVVLTVTLLVVACGPSEAATESPTPHAAPAVENLAAEPTLSALDEHPTEPVPSPVLSAETATALDYGAIDYAAATGVDIAEARRRAPLLEELKPTLRSIREAGNSLAGLFIEHNPDLRVHLRLTAKPSPTLQAILDRSPVPVVVSADAALSVYDSRRRLELATPGLARAVPELMGTFIDERTGEAVMDVFVQGTLEEVAAAKSRIEAAAAALAREIGLPVRIDYLSGPLLEDLDLPGIEEPTGR